MTIEAGKVVRLSERVRRLTAPNPSFMTGPGTNTYIIGDQELTVIDPGPVIDSHIQMLAELGNVRHILVTHTHPDHSPAALKLKELTGANLYGNPTKTSDICDQTFVADRDLHDGYQVVTAEYSITSIHTPGHAKNHLCYILDDEKMLFSGDHIMSGATVVIFPPHGEMDVYMKTLRDIKTRDLLTIAPGHGDVMEQPHVVVDTILAHRTKRENAILNVLQQQGNKKIKEIVTIEYTETPKVLYEMAARQVWAHLIKLEKEGRVAGKDLESEWSFVS